MQIRCIAALAVALGLGLGLPLHALEPPSAALQVDVGGVPRTLYTSSEALLIYGSEYTKGWDRLPTVALEVTELQTALKAHGFNVKIISNKTGQVIRTEVNDFIAEHGSANKRILIYYAGHGWRDPKTGRGYLVPVDAPLPSRDRTQFNKVSISESQVRSWSEEVLSRHAIFIFDSCFAGAIFGKRGEPEQITLPSGVMSPPMYDRIVPESVYFMSATDDVSETPSRGAYTKRLIAGLRGAADTNKDGYIWATELGEWLKDQFKDSEEYKPRYGPTDSYRWSDTGVVFMSPMGLPPRRTARAEIPRLVRISDQAPPAPQAEYPPRERTRSEGAKSLVQGGWFIRYYEKAADQGHVLDILERERLRYLAFAPQLPQTYKTNAIACHPDGDVGGARSLALLLHDAGVHIAAILPFSNRTKPMNRIEILSVASANGPWTAPSLSRRQLEQLTECKAMNNG